MSVVLVVGGIIGGIVLLLFALLLLPFVKFRMSFLKRYGRPPTKYEVDAWAATWMEEGKGLSTTRPAGPMVRKGGK